MKFTIAEKEFEIQPAKTKSILQIEERLGKSLSKIGDDVSFSDIITIVTIALTQSDANIDVSQSRSLQKGQRHLNICD